LLRSKAQDVATGLRRAATYYGLSEKEAEPVHKAADYIEKNQARPTRKPPAGSEPAEVFLIGIDTRRRNRQNENLSYSYNLSTELTPMKSSRLSPLILSSLILGAAALPSLAAAAELNLYSARKEELIKPLLDRFTAQSGIQVNLLTGKEDALLQRLQSEGENSPADLFLTTDAGRLHRAKAAGVLQAAGSKVLDETVPAHYRDEDGQWYGLSVRARVVMYAKDRVKPEQLSSYADLADPKWKKKICIRSSDNIYNQSLVAALIAHDGEAATEAWIKGLLANLARKPAGGDRDQIKAVAAGECDLAVANTYYLGGMLNDKDEAERKAAQQVAVFWPDQQGNGVHVNVSGAGVTKWAKNRAEAVKLLEFLVSDEAQQWYAEQNHEYPVKAGVATSDLLKGWGEFKADPLPMSKLGELNPAAVKAMDRAGWQ